MGQTTDSSQKQRRSLYQYAALLYLPRGRIRWGEYVQAEVVKYGNIHHVLETITDKSGLISKELALTRSIF